MNQSKPLNVMDLGLVPYRQAYELQRDLHSRRIAETIPDTLILLEHPHVFTLGKRGTTRDIIWPEEVLKRKGVEVVQSDRGGQVTYHGPGQLVGYLIINLYNQDRKIRRFIGDLEQIFVTILQSEYGLSAEPSQTDPGIWIGKNKITALGLRIQNKVSLHGFGFNVHPDLEYFTGIIPCGISGDGRGVTSLSRELEIQGKPMDPGTLMNRVKGQIVEEFCTVFGYDSMD